MNANVETQGTAFLTKIVAAVNGLFNEIIPTNPDNKHNAGRFLAAAYFWDAVQSIAKGRADKAWKALEANKLIEEKERDPGEYELATSPHFICALKVSEKVNRFSADALAKALSTSKYKVPVPIARQYIEAAKIPSKSTNTYRIVEKAV